MEGASTPTALFVVLFLWLNCWLRNIWCGFLFTDIMDLHMSSLATLVPEWPCCVFYATMCQGVEVWHIIWFFASTLIWYQTNTETKTQHTLGSINWYTHINIYKNYENWAYSNYVYYIELLIVWYQKFTFHNIFAI